MKIEYIIQKESYKAKIVVITSEFRLDEWKYTIRQLLILPKGKRKWISVTDDIRDRHEYKILKFNSEERQQYIKEQFLKYVSEEDIQNAVNYAYEQLKPEFNEIEFRIF